MTPARIESLVAPAPARTIAGDSIDGRVAVVDIVATRGHEPPMHRFRHEDVVVVVLEGNLILHLEAQRFTIRTGCYAVIPRGNEYGYEIESESARLLLVLTPGGAETCLAELHGATSPSLERLVTTAARHGVEITGPPPGRRDTVTTT